MKISWNTVADRGEEFIVMRAASDTGATARIVALQPGGASRFLMPVRLVNAEDVSEDGFSRPMDAHAKGLQDKIASIDRLRLSEIRFADKFRAARMLVACEDGVHSDMAWGFAREVIDQLASKLPIPAVTQIDYDQKRFHGYSGSSLDSIDFAVKHDPSARATTISFRKILEVRGVSLKHATVSVTGVGDLGGRLVQEFIRMGVGSVLVADRDGDRLERAAARPGVIAVDLKDIPRLPTDAQVLSADKSFTDEIGQQWCRNERVVAVGGPEAGLDRFVPSRKRFEECRKEFVPSVLCGCLGLVTNLEEGLGVIPDLPALDRRFSRLIDVFTNRMNDSGRSLAAVCEEVLAGSENLTSEEVCFIWAS